MKPIGTDVADAIALWPVFSIQMIAGYLGEPEADVRAKLDALAAAGILTRRLQRDRSLPAIYYRARG